MQLGELGRILTGKTPSTKNADFWDGSIPFVTPKDIQGLKQIENTERYVTRSGLAAVKGAILPPRAICVSCIGNIGYVGMTTVECVSNQQINSIVVNDDNDADFVYYLIKSLWPYFKNYEGQSTTLSILNKTQFSKIEVSVPTLEMQKRIAKVLSAIDAKIAINQKINDNLLQQAQLLYNEMFVCNPLISSWELTTIRKLSALVNRGLTPKYSDDSDQLVLNQKCVRNHMIDVSLARRHIPKSINEKWLQFGDLLINSTGEGTLGRTAQVWFEPSNMTVDTHMTIVRPKSAELIYYLGLWGLTHEKEIEAEHTGSTGQTELPRERVGAMQLVMPDKDTLNTFNATVAPMLHQVTQNQTENRLLAEMRDTLLPKLLSGEINVTNDSLGS